MRNDEIIPTPFYLNSCSNCKELIEIEICNLCLDKLFKQGKQKKHEINKKLLCKDCLKKIEISLCENCVGIGGTINNV